MLVSRRIRMTRQRLMMVSSFSVVSVKGRVKVLGFSSERELMPLFIYLTGLIGCLSGLSYSRVYPHVFDAPS